MTKLGADISNYQTGYEAATYARYHEYIIFKSSEGLNWTDNLFARRREAAAKQGTQVGIYHYAHPGRNPAGAEAGPAPGTQSHPVGSCPWTGAVAV